MKVLHIWNTAGVAGNIAEYLNEFYQVKGLVLWRKKYDPYGLKRRHVKFVGGGTLYFHLVCFVHAIFYDVIHFHSIDRWLFIYRLLFPRKKVIIHYHGSDIRNKWRKNKKNWIWANDIIISTPDLADDETPLGKINYIPNMVNHRLCKIFYYNDKIKGSAFHINIGALDEALEIARKRRLRLNVLSGSMSHYVLLKNLSYYEYYIDIKRHDGEILEAYSLTGLEAFNMNVKVINWNNEGKGIMPKGFRPRDVASELMRVYNG